MPARPSADSALGEAPGLSGNKTQLLILEPCREGRGPAGPLEGVQGSGLVGAIVQVPPSVVLSLAGGVFFFPVFPAPFFQQGHFCTSALPCVLQSVSVALRIASTHV